MPDDEYEYSYLDDDVPPGWWDECRADLDAPQCYCERCKASEAEWRRYFTSGALKRDMQRDVIAKMSTADIILDKWAFEAGRPSLADDPLFQ